jgi:hypothetical protein
MRVLLNSNIEIYIKWSKLLKSQYHLQKLKVLPIDLDKKYILPHPLSHMGNEGGACKGLKTIIKEGITIINLTQTPPIFSTRKDGWGNNHNK